MQNVELQSYVLHILVSLGILWIGCQSNHTKKANAENNDCIISRVGLQEWS